MEFDQKKLPIEAGSTLRPVRLADLRPYALMSAPVYVYLQKNEKYVAVKAPLDFFTPDELAKLSSMETIYFSEFALLVEPFLMAAARVRAILSWELGQDGLGPTPFEVSDTVLRILGPLWSRSGRLEPFFSAAFAEALCGNLKDTALTRAREAGAAALERAALTSGFAVVLALLLGWCDLAWLSELRARAFEMAPSDDVDEQELLGLVAAFLDETPTGAISYQWFENRPERIAQKIAARLERVRGQLAIAEREVSISGPMGFRQAGAEAQSA